MRFVEPQWLYVGGAACVVLAGSMAWSARRSARLLARFVAAPHVRGLTRSLSTTRRRLKMASLLLGTACVFAALARPQWGYHTEQQRQEGSDLLFAVDTSKSMLAEDLRPNRLSRAKLAVEQLSGELGGDRLGLVAFAGDAFLQTPLTHDRTAFAQSLQALDTSIIPVGGTDLESALRVAEEAFTSEPDHHKVLVLLSDGEELTGTAVAAAKRAAEKNITIHTVGIGSAQAALVPTKNARGESALLRDPEGELVRTRLDEGTLREVARATGGTYHALDTDGRGLLALERELSSKHGDREHGTVTKRVYQERFQWPLGMALALLALELVLHERRRASKRALQRRRELAGVAAALGLTVLFAGTAAASEPAPLEAYNAASASYRAGDFAAAAEGYRSALDARDLSLQARSYYDLGNALYRLGQREGEGRSELAKQRYREAIEAYESALALEPSDQDAAFNRDFVRRKLNELESAQEPPRERPNDGEESSPSAQQESGAAEQQQQTGADEAQADEAEAQADEAQADGARADETQQSGGKEADGEPSAQQTGGSDAREQGEQKGASSADSAGQANPRDGDTQEPESASGESDPPERAESGADPEGAQRERAGGPDEGADKAEAEQAEEPDGDGKGEEARPDGEHGDGTREDEMGSDGSTAEADDGPEGASRGRALTQDEAARLLDSLAGELRRLPSGYGQRARSRTDAEHSRKDW